MPNTVGAHFSVKDQLKKNSKLYPRKSTDQNQLFYKKKRLLMQYNSGKWTMSLCTTNELNAIVFKVEEYEHFFQKFNRQPQFSSSWRENVVLKEELRKDSDRCMSGRPNNLQSRAGEKINNITAWACVATNTVERGVDAVQ